MQLRACSRLSRALLALERLRALLVRYLPASMAVPLEVKLCHAIHVGTEGLIVIPPIAEVVDDVPFVRLSRTAGWLIKVVTCKPKQTERTLNARFFNVITKKRDDACRDWIATAVDAASNHAPAVLEHHVDLFAEESNDAAPPPRQRRRVTAGEASAIEKPNTIDVTFEAIHHGDICVGPLTVKCLFETSGKCICVELTANVMHYIRIGVLQSLAVEDVGRAPRAARGDLHINPIPGIVGVRLGRRGFVARWWDASGRAHRRVFNVDDETDRGAARDAAVSFFEENHIAG